MNTTASEVADFYQQLALLIRSNLPLPDSLRQLGRYFPNREFQNVILALSERTARGEKFADILRQYPRFFPPFHVQLITAGEAAGTLPEILFAVARSARFAQLMTARVRDLTAYPLLTVHLCFVTFFLLSVYVISGFGAIFADILDGEHLPALTHVVLGVATSIRNAKEFIVPVYLVFLAFSLWLFTPGMRAHQTLLTVINGLPGSLRIVHSLDSSRLCSMLSTFLRQKMPFPTALETTSELVQQRKLQQALSRAAHEVEAGGDLVEALSRERWVDRLIVLTFRHTPEAELPQELERLSELFEHRVTLSARSATLTWAMFAMIFMTLSVALVVIAMFLPLISIITVLGR